jgi:hypothetical protein
VSKAWYHKNHEDPVACEIEVAELIALPPRPDTFLAKKEFVDWSSNPGTDHCFYNFWEGQNAAERIAKVNGPAFLHGFCADYDVQNLEQTAIDRAIKDCPSAFPCAYVSRTFSGGIRLLWRFEAPVPVFNEDVAKGIAKRAIKELKLKKLAPGFDEEAFVDVAKYYELGTDWKPCSPERTIPSSYLTTWAFEASQKAKFEGGKSIPLEAIAAEGQKRWPGRCPEVLTEGMMCVRWWDPTATNPKGAWIRESGVQAFTGECKFLHWDVIFGKEWVAQFEADRIGGAIGNVWYDGKAYWSKSRRGIWDDQNTDVFRRALRCDGLNAESVRGAPSEVDRAMHTVETDNRLDGGFPFLYSEKDIHMLRGKRYLNVSRVQPTLPASGTRYWPEGFPFIASILEGMFDPQQLQVLLGWLSHAYQGAISHQARQGHALFIVGAVGSGKTLISQRIIGEALGGFSEGTSFIMGKDMFNSELFESGVWCVDDAEIAADRQKHELYSQIIKKVVANPAMTYRRMYSEGVTLPWMGRLVVTLNENAIEMLPDIEAELLDKVHFLKARTSNVKMGEKVDNDARIASELPAFLAHVRDYVIPEEMKDTRGNRFGMKSYHHPELIDAAKASSPSANFAEIVNQWRAHYFTLEDKKTEWSGTALELQQELNEDGALTQIVKQTVRNTNHLGKMLGQLVSQGAKGISKKRTSANWVYVLAKP